MKTATIQRQNSNWDADQAFASTLCTVSDGIVYRRRWNGRIEESLAQLVVTKGEGWQKSEYSFHEIEPKMVYHSRVQNPEVFQCGAWCEELRKEEEGVNERYLCGNFVYVCDRATGSVRFQIPDEAWRRRQIIIGFYVYDRYFPRKD